MTRYRKKPVEIEARQFATPEDGETIASWCGGRYEADVKPSDHTDAWHKVTIPTLEGPITASLGDFVIRGVKGEFYPCKPDIFESTYESVEATHIGGDAS